MATTVDRTFRPGVILEHGLPQEPRATSGSELLEEHEECRQLIQEVNAFRAPKLKLPTESGVCMGDDRVRSYRQEFGLPATAEFCGHFLCALQKGASYRRGHLLIFSTCIVFKSNVFGHYQRITIDFRGITNIRKRTFFKLPNTIVVTRRDEEGEGLQDEIFTTFSFASRQIAYNVLVDQWRRINPAASTELPSRGDGGCGMLDGKGSFGGTGPATTLPLTPQPAAAFPPVPEDMQLVASLDFPGMDMDTFTEVILSDASGFYPYVAQQEGHDPRSISSWSPCPAAYPGVNSSCSRVIEYNYVNKGPWGNVKCLSTITQQATLFEGRRLVLENKQEMPDLPAVGKAFHIAIRWEVQQLTAPAPAAAAAACGTDAGSDQAAADTTAGGAAGSIRNTPLSANSPRSTAATGPPPSFAAGSSTAATAGTGVVPPDTPNSAAWQTPGGAREWGDIGRASPLSQSASNGAAAAAAGTSRRADAPSPNGLTEALQKASRGLADAFRIGSTSGSSSRGRNEALPAGYRRCASTTAASPRAAGVKLSTLQKFRGSMQIQSLMRSSSRKPKGSKLAASNLLSSGSAEEDWEAAAAAAAADAGGTPRASCDGGDCSSRPSDSPMLRIGELSALRCNSSPAASDCSTNSTGTTVVHRAKSHLAPAADSNANSRGMANGNSVSTRSAPIGSPSSTLRGDVHAPAGSAAAGAAREEALYADAAAAVAAAESSSLAKLSPVPLGGMSPAPSAASLSSLAQQQKQQQQARSRAATPADNASCQGDSPSRQHSCMADGSTALAAAAPEGSTPGMRSSAQHPAAAADGSCAGAAGLTWNIYLAVRFANKRHLLRGKVEKGTFDSVPPLYQAMLRLADTWLRDPQERRSMATVMPHLPVRGRHRRSPSIHHRRSNSLLQRSGTITGSRGRPSTEDLGGLPGAAAPSLLQRTSRAAAAVAAATGRGVAWGARQVGLRELLLAGLLVVAVLQLMVWEQVLALGKEVVELMREQREQRQCP